MFQKYIIPPLLLVTLSCSAAIESDGVNVKVTDTAGKVSHVLVKRDIPDECKKVIIDNDTLWAGNYAHKSVPEACKSTYVHTKGKLLAISLGPDVETYGELEVLLTLKEMQRSDKVILVDSRKDKWFKYRTIPGAVNMPYNYFKEKDDYVFHFEYALKYLNVVKDSDGDFDFDNAKTLVVFCNGPWCDQSPNMIFALINIGYPEEKLKWYRGGMQDWLSTGMTSTRK